MKKLSAKDLMDMVADGATVKGEKSPIQVENLTRLAEAFERVAESNERLIASRNQEILNLTENITSQFSGAMEKSDLAPVVALLSELVEKLIAVQDRPVYKFDLERDEAGSLRTVTAMPSYSSRIH